MLQALAVATSPSGAAMRWKAVEVTQIGDAIFVPRISVSVPWNFEVSTKARYTSFMSLKAWYCSFRECSASAPELK